MNTSIDVSNVSKIATKGPTLQQYSGHPFELGLYAQDKMEQLLTLAYGDATSDTRVFPATASGGTGLAVGGSSNPDAPTDGYVDYLDVNGNLLPSTGVAAPAGWYFKRAWAVSAPAANLKQVTVTVTVSLAFGRMRKPSSTMTAHRPHRPCPPHG